MKALAPLIIATALAAVTNAPATWAQEPSVDPRIAAETLFEEGVALGEKHHWVEACKKLEASQALDAAVGTLLRLGDCYERIGRRASAWARFREAQSLARAQAMTDRERIATLRADALGPKLARVTLLVNAPISPELRIKLNGAEMPRAVWGSALPVDAGTVSLEASAPGYVTYERELSISGREGAHISVTIPPLEPQPPPLVTEAPHRSFAARPATPASPAAPPAPAGDGGYGVRALGVTFAVVGGVGLGAAGGLALLSKRRNDRSLEECPQSPRLCTARGVQLREEAKKLANAGTITAAAGGGLFATGIVLYLIGAGQRHPEAASVDVSPELSESRWGLLARGRF